MTYLHALDPNNELKPIKANADQELIVDTGASYDEDGNLKIAGTFSAAPPVGGATEAKQDDQIDLLGGGLPAALTGSGNLKVAIVESTGGGLTDDELRAADVKVTLDGEAVTTAPGSVVGSNTSVVGVEFTRPSDTTAYAARDVVCNSTSSPSVITFADFARVNQGSGIIIRARLFTDKKDVTAQFRLHLFHTAPTAINDNSPYLLLYANAANRIGQIDFPAMASEDPTNSTASATMRPSSDGGFGPPNLWYQAASGSRAIYGVLETLSAFTPASGQKFFIQLAAIND